MSKLTHGSSAGYRLACGRALSRLFTLVVIAQCSLLPSSSVAQQTVSNPDVVMHLDWQVGSWQTMWQTRHFASDAVDQDVGYYIYLPPQYTEKTTQRYPVIYWLHGAYGRPHAATPIVRRLDRQIRAGRLPPMIIVSSLDPTGLGMWTDAKSGQLPLETILMTELIPHVDKTYRTIATRASRAIEGFSMGGYGAAYLGFKYHEVFSSISMLAAALHTPGTLRERRRVIFDNVFGGETAYAEARSPWSLARQNAAHVRDQTSVRIFVGANDGLRNWNREFHTLLSELGVDHEWGIVPDATHDVGMLMQNWEGEFFAYYAQHFAE